MDVTRVEIGARTAERPPPAERLRLTTAQFLMWMGQEIDPAAPLYNMVHTFRFAGAIDVDAFAAAWASVVAGSDTLRTVIRADEDGPYRLVLDVDRDAVDVSVPVVDVRGEPDPVAAWRAWVGERRSVPLPLATRPWEVALLRTGSDETVWYLAQHHIVSDAHSFAVVVEAVAERYALALQGQLDEAPELPRYEAFVEHERDARDSKGWTKAVDHWAGKAARGRVATDFYGRTVSGRDDRTDRLVVDIDRGRCERLREIATTREFASISAELSQSTIWTTLWIALIHRISGRSDVRVGMPFLGRPTAAFRSTIGLFVQVGAIDVAIGAGGGESDTGAATSETFATLGSQVRKELVQGLRHARPGSATAELNRSYDVLVNHVTSRFPTFADIAFDNEWWHSGHGDRDHALRVQVTDFESTGEVRLHVDVNADLFGPAQRNWLLTQFDTLLDRFLENPTRSLDDFDLLDDRQRDALAAFNDTRRDEVDPDLDIATLIERQVDAAPDAVAIEHDDRQLTYRELDRLADRVAARLRGLGVRAGDRVALHLPRSLDAVVATLGVAKSGGAWVPIDPSYPERRRRWMIDDADPTVVIVPDGTDDTTAIAGERSILHIADVTASDRHDAMERTVRSAEPDGLAYMIYTSGSTGVPKGTMLTRRGLVNYLWWAREQYAPDGPNDFPLYSSLSFDLTITSLFVPLLTGGRIVVYDRADERDGLEILDVFDDDAVDVVKLTPAHLGLLREHGIAPQRIRRLVVGGENLRTDLAASIADRFPNGVEIYNEYGPTEAVVGCMIHRFDPTTDTGPSVPIGAPARNARVHVLDAAGHPVPPGVIGEMVIAGDGVALGYWRRPELTAERFGPDPEQPGGRRYRTGDLARWGADGRLEFLGRNDYQVKIRGARIELGEIESALEAHVDVDQAVVDVVAFVDQPVGGAAGLQHCITCGLPSNTPGSDFDDCNECRDCRDFAHLQDEVARYFRTPEQLRDELATRSAAAAVDRYDSLVLVSGGKDSTYMLYQLVREYGVRPLVFLLDNGFIAERAITNVRAACADLGLDVHVATTEHMNEIFVDSLHRHANVCDGCYKTIYTLSLGLARAHGIRTIITGLARGQLFETRLADTFAAREFDPDAIDRWVMEARKTYHRIDDAVTRRLNGDLFDDDRVFDEIGFVDFYRYIDVDLDEVYAYLEDHTVWERPADTGRSTNCLINDVGIHVHNTTRGYHNYALPYSWDVRLGHKHRETAMDELDDEIDLDRVRHILDEIGFDRDLDGSRSEPRLAAYYVGPPELTATDLRAHLEASIPANMVPTFLVRLDELPLTVNGKIDRAALPDPGAGRPELRTAFVAPRTELERTLAELWADVLPVADIGIEDDFFELGGDSITCIQVVAAARRGGLALSARAIFTERTIARIASTIATDDTPAGGETERVIDVDPMTALDADERAAVEAAFGRDGSDTAVIDDLYPLTPVQLGMLYHCLRVTRTPTYYGQAVCSFSHAELGGAIDVDRLRRAWQAVIDRHASLRTRFVWTGLDEPLQAVLRHLDAPWTTHDWRGRDSYSQDRDLDELLSSRRRDGFDLEAGVPMTFDAVVTDDRTVLAWGTHHALLDGWSAQLLHDEALAAYDADDRGRSLPAPPRPFRRYVESLQARDRGAALDWWHATLNGVDETTPAPFARHTISGDEPSHQSRIRRLGRSESDRLASFARAHGVTVGSLTTAAWALVVARHAGRDDVIIGATVSGREDGFDGVDDMIGMLLATVPVRLRVDDRPVATWLRDAQLAAFEARDRVEVGLADIQRVTDLPTTAPLVESIVVIENYPAATGGGVLGAPDLTITSPSNFPIAVLVHPGEELGVELVIDERYVTDDEADRLALQVEHTLRSLTESPDRPITEVSALPDDELAAIRSAELGAPLPEPDELVLDRVARYADERPDELAVVCGATALSYADLDGRADRIAHGLAAGGLARRCDRRGNRCRRRRRRGDAGHLAGRRDVRPARSGPAHDPSCAHARQHRRQPRDRPHPCCDRRRRRAEGRCGG